MTSKGPTQGELPSSRGAVSSLVLNTIEKQESFIGTFFLNFFGVAFPDSAP